MYIYIYMTAEDCALRLTSTTSSECDCGGGCVYWLFIFAVAAGLKTEGTADCCLYIAPLGRGGPTYPTAAVPACPCTSPPAKLLLLPLPKPVLFKL